MTSIRARIVSAIVGLLLLAAPAIAADDSVKFSKAQLDQLLAPIALYPDDLLSNVLMASTYPLDIVEAARWRKDPANAQLKGDALTDALKAKSWDPSVKALVQFPDVLSNMSDKLDWTQKLGDAFIAQQDQVMNEIQFLRAKADESGHLKSNDHQTVAKEAGSGTPPADIYTIEPTNPDVVYVPDYEPSVVYGPWWYPEYPPYAWSYPGVDFVDGFFWAAGIGIAGGIWGWNHWDWRNRHINVNVNRWNAINNNRNRHIDHVWRHDRHHRGNVPRGDKNFNRADIQRRLQNADHPGAAKKLDHGAQLRHNARHFAKNKPSRPHAAHARGGAAARKFVKRNPGHAARAVHHVRRPAVHRHAGGRRGGVRRRR